MTDEYISREALLNKFIEGDGDDEFAEGYNFAVNEYREEIKNMPAADVKPVNQWISVDDRLPEEIGYYLVVIGNEMLISIDIAEYSEGYWHIHDKVLYWQPLPEPPKDGDTE